MAIALLALAAWPGVTRGAVLDPQAQLDAQTFWDNRDWDWYKQNIPFFECPDADITTTYYYRWELTTKHLTYGSPNTTDWLEADLGIPRPIHTVKLYFLDDGEKVTPPAQFALEYWTGSAWESTPGQTRSPAQPAGRRANVVHFPELKLQQLRAVFTHGPDGRTGVTDDDRGGVQPPASYTIETWTGSAWREVPDQVKTPALPVGSAINTVRFPRQTTTKFRVVFTHQGQARSGLTEILAWAD